MEESEDWWNFECNSHKKMEEFVDRCFFFATAAPEIIKVDPDSVFFPSWGLRHILTPQSGSRVCELPVLLKRLKFKVTWYMRLFFFLLAQHGINWRSIMKCQSQNHVSPAEFTLCDSNLWPRTAETSHWKTRTVSWLKRSEKNCWSSFTKGRQHENCFHQAAAAAAVLGSACNHWIKPGFSHLQEIRDGTNSKLLPTKG